MPQTRRWGPTTAPSATYSLTAPRVADATGTTPDRAQRRAAAWLAGPHTGLDCPTCAAGWNLIGGAR